MLWLLAALLLAGPTRESLQAQEHLKEGQSLMAKERFEDAARQFREAIRFDPLLMMAHYGLGQSQMALKQFPSAVTAFQGARKAFHDAAAESLTLKLENDNAREERIRDLQDKIRDNVGRTVPAGSRAERVRDQRITQWEMEIAMLQRSRNVQASQETPAGLSLALGSAHFRSGQMAEAEREYRAALTVNSKLAEARNNLAVVLLLTGRPSDAQEQLRLAEKNGFKAAAGLKKDVEAALATSSNTPRP
jgi:tetratricopeptide (TPR) repeat protein